MGKKSVLARRRKEEAGASSSSTTTSDDGIVVASVVVEPVVDRRTALKKSTSKSGKKSYSLGNNNLSASASIPVVVSAVSVSSVLPPERRTHALYFDCRKDLAPRNYHLEDDRQEKEPEDNKNTTKKKMDGNKKDGRQTAPSPSRAFLMRLWSFQESKWWKTACTFISYIGSIAFVALHVYSIFMLLYGIYLHPRFHHGKECDMTYSARNYIPVPVRQVTTIVPSTVSTTVPLPPYKLYKFVDGRDPRWKSYLQRDNVDDSDHPPFTKRNYCSRNTHVVLYIPGHWGSYRQCRSLGAHGVGLTRKSYDRKEYNTIIQHLRDGTYNGTTYDSKHFAYDTFCVDFAEQGSALHGSFMRSQTSFVNDVITQLAADCEVGHEGITLVGHSVGGLVARGVPALYGMNEHVVRNIITFATPHSGMAYVYDDSVLEFFYEITAGNEVNQDLLMISISGGLRDEITPSFNQYLEFDDQRALAIQSPFIMEKGTVEATMKPACGMDHKAIVWCHNLLTTIKEVIFFVQLAAGEQYSARGRMGIVWNNLLADWLAYINATKAYDFEEGFFSDIDELFGNKDTEYNDNWIPVQAIETFEYFNVTVVLTLYVILGGLYSYMFFPGFSHSPFRISVLLIVFGWLSSIVSELTFTGTFQVAFVSHALLLAVLESSQTLRRRFFPKGLLSHEFIIILVTSVGAIFRLGWATLYMMDMTKKLCTTTTLWIELSVYIWLLSLKMLFREYDPNAKQQHDRDAIFAALVVMAWPFMVSGKVYVSIWSFFQPELLANKWVGPDILYIGIPLILRLRPSPNPNVGMEDYDPSIQFLFRFFGTMVSVVGFYPICVQMGAAHLGYYLISLSAMENIKRYFFLEPLILLKRD